MKITFYAHASFRLEADGVVVITDPYKPPLSRFDPIDEPHFDELPATWAEWHPSDEGF